MEPSRVSFPNGKLGLICEKVRSDGTFLSVCGVDHYTAESTPPSGRLNEVITGINRSHFLIYCSVLKNMLHV